MFADNPKNKSILLIVLAGTLPAVTHMSYANTLEDMFIAGGRWQWNGKEKGGLVLEDPNCGCEAIFEKLGKSQPSINHDDSWEVPTRCAKENNKRGSRRYVAYNDRGQKYPSFAGLGAGFSLPKGYPKKAPKMSYPNTQGDPVPWPGWPAAKPPRGKKASEWDGERRRDYKKRYTSKSIYDGKAPGKVSQGYEVPGSKRIWYWTNKTAWTHWQIHHVLEQKHNGTDDFGNFAPVYSFPNSWTTQTSDLRKKPNKHSFYTQWWQNIRVDSEFYTTRKLGKEFPEVWPIIKKCKVKKWP